MAEYQVEFETSLSEIEVVKWFEYNIVHEQDDFRLTYVRDGYYSSAVDAIVDCHLIRNNPEFRVCAVQTMTDDAPRVT